MYILNIVDCSVDAYNCQIFACCHVYDKLQGQVPAGSGSHIYTAGAQLQVLVTCGADHRTLIDIQQFAMGCTFLFALLIPVVKSINCMRTTSNFFTETRSRRRVEHTAQHNHHQHKRCRCRRCVRWRRRSADSAATSSATTSPCWKHRCWTATACCTYTTYVQICIFVVCTELLWYNAFVMLQSIPHQLLFWCPYQLTPCI